MPISTFREGIFSWHIFIFSKVFMFSEKRTHFLSRLLSGGSSVGLGATLDMGRLSGQSSLKAFQGLGTWPIFKTSIDPREKLKQLTMINIGQVRFPLNVARSSYRSSQVADKKNKAKNQESTEKCCLCYHLTQTKLQAQSNFAKPTKTLKRH